MINYRIKILLCLVLLQISCKKLIEVEAPINSLVQNDVFKSDEIASSLITGIYANMAISGYASGNSSSISAVCGASADEFLGYNPLINEFSDNQLTSTNFYIANSLYELPYKSIYAANSIIEGLSSPNGVTPQVNIQLRGEALFVRAFVYFYLVNMYGPVPLQLTTDYRITQIEPRSTTDIIYQQILRDLKESENLLQENYVTNERIRPNKSVVQTMLARVYLYLKDWQNAERYASLVINKSATYKLCDKLDDIFIKNSSEAIWQLMPTANTNSLDGNLHILVSAPADISLRKDFVDNAFEENDLRKSTWVKRYDDNTGSYFYANKYKIKDSNIITEYSMVLRLGELYLIRAEAYINQNQIGLGISDLNSLRARSRPLATGSIINPLPPLSNNLSQQNALLAVEQERRVELFSEWGHRWFDLKRIGKANISLGHLKPNWHDTDLFYPLPYDEITRNKNITQNDGY